MRITIPLIINTVLLITVTGALSFLIVDAIDIRRLYKMGVSRWNKEKENIRISNQIKKYTTAMGVELTLFEKLEIRFIEKTGLKKIPFANLYTLILISVIIAAVTFTKIYIELSFLLTAFFISVTAALIPFVILDMIGKRKTENIRKNLAEFISILSRWCAVKEDIFFAFKKSTRSGLAEPLKSYIEDLVIQVESGVDPQDALDMLSYKVDNEQFQDFVVNIKQSVKSRGDIRKLLSNLEDQYYKIQEEYNRRKISTMKDRFIIYGTMGITVFVIYQTLTKNQDIKEFYLYTLGGKFLLAVISLFFLAGLVLTLRISRFKY